MDLLFDIGNSRIKWAAGDGADWAGVGTLSDASEVSGLWFDDIDRVAIAATGHGELAEAVERASARRWRSVPLMHAQTESRFDDLRNAYATPANMGVDRWLAMIAAWSLKQSACCVIDAGTAITVDLIDAHGMHQGGWICPGARLMREALAVGTARVGHRVADTPQRWGDDTPDAVAAGTREAVAGLVQRAAALASETAPGTSFIVTGGGAEEVAGHLGKSGVEAVVKPMLIFEGLRIWLQRQSH